MCSVLGHTVHISGTPISTWDSEAHRASHHHRMFCAEAQLKMGATTQQTKQKPHLYLLPKSSSLVSAVQSQSLQTCPWLEFSRLTSPTDALFCKYSFFGMVSASWRCFLFLVGPVSAPRTLLGLSWSSVSIQWTVSHLMSILCAGLTVWTEGPSHFQLLLEAKIASVLGPSKHSTSPNLVS